MAQVQRYGIWLRITAVVIVMVMVMSPAMISASSVSDSQQEDSSASSVPDSSMPDSQAEPTEESVLAPSGEGLYKPEYTPMAEAWCMINEETGLFVSEKNADAVLVPGSLVKMMTVLLAMEQVEKFGWDLDTTMVDTTDATWVYDIMVNYRATVGEPSHADIRQGETLSLRELFYAALLPSANEAAMILADYVSTGSMVNFMYMMNTRADSLGCENTYFVDVTGMSEDNRTTARDMTIITRAFMDNETLVEMAREDAFEIAAHEKHTSSYYVHATNRLVVPSSPYYQAFYGIGEYIVAGKTGSLGEWQNFASKASKGGESYICVVMNSPYEADLIAPTQGTEEEPAPERPALYETAALYDWAFNNLYVDGVIDTSLAVTEVPVEHAMGQDTLKLLPTGDVRVVLHQDVGEEIVKRSYTLPQYIEAPIEEGEVVGSIELSIGEQEIGSIPLKTEKSVERNSTVYAINRVEDFFSSTYFMVLLVLVLMVVGGYAAVVIFGVKRHKQGKPTFAVRRRAKKAPPRQNKPAKRSTQRKQRRRTTRRQSSAHGKNGQVVDSWRLPVEKDGNVPFTVQISDKTRNSKKKR